MTNALSIDEMMATLEANGYRHIGYDDVGRATYQRLYFGVTYHGITEAYQHYLEQEELKALRELKDQLEKVEYFLKRGDADHAELCYDENHFVAQELITRRIATGSSLIEAVANWLAKYET